MVLLSAVFARVDDLPFVIASSLVGNAQPCLQLSEIFLALGVFGVHCLTLGRRCERLLADIIVSAFLIALVDEGPGSVEDFALARALGTEIREHLGSYLLVYAEQEKVRLLPHRWVAALQVEESVVDQSVDVNLILRDIVGFNDSLKDREPPCQVPGTKIS